MRRDLGNTPEESDMRLKSIYTMAAAALALAVGSTADAALDFTVQVAPDSAYFTINGPAATILNVGQTGTTTLDAGALASLPTSGIFSADLTGIDVNFAQPTITSTMTAPEAIKFTYGYDVTIHDTVTDKSATALITGTIGGTASITGSSLTAFGFAANPNMMDLGGDLFSLSASTNAPFGTGTAPSINSLPGALVIHVADPIPLPPSAVPEPASIALMGLGGLGVLGMLRHRRTNRI